jgi:hypothetical protein
MAASGYTPIQLYRTATASAAPVAGNLTSGELAINYNAADMALYAKNGSGSVIRLMNNPAGLKYPTADGTNGQVLTTNGSGVLSWASAATGFINGSGTTNYIPKFTSSSAIGNSVIYDDGTNVGIGTSSPAGKLDVNGGVVAKAFNATNTPVVFESAGGAVLAYNGSGNGVLRAYADAAGAGGQLLFYSGGSERMRIDSSGNVGIGTSSPASRLEITSTTNTVADLSGSLRITNLSGTSNTYAGVLFKTFDSLNSFVTGIRTSSWGGILSFAVNDGTNGTSLVERMRIDSSGSVGIGTSSPLYALDVSAVGAAFAVVDVARIYANASAAASARLLFGSAALNANSAIVGHTLTATDGALRFQTRNAGGLNNRMSIDPDGNVGIKADNPAYYGNGLVSVADGYNNIVAANQTTASGTGFAIQEYPGVNKLVLGTYGSTYPAGSFFGIGPNGSALVQLTTAALAIGTYGVAQPVLFGTNSVERMRIDPSGNVGIGTSSPDNKLVIETTSSNVIENALTLRNYGSLNGTGSAIKFGYGDTASNLYGARITAYGYPFSYRPYSIGFERANGAGNGWDQSMVIDYTGNVGIGTSSPTTRLSIAKDVSATTALDTNFISLYNGLDGGSAIEFTNSVSGKARIVLGPTSSGTGTDDTIIAFGTSLNAVYAERMRITSSGNVGIGTTTPLFRGYIESYEPDRGIIAAVSNGPATATTGAQLGFHQGGIAYWTIGQPGGVNAFAIWKNRWTGLDGQEVLRIDSSGNVGIGTSSPTTKLDVSGGISTNEGVLAVGAGFGGNVYLDGYTAPLVATATSDAYYPAIFTNATAGNSYGTGVYVSDSGQSTIYMGNGTLTAISVVSYSPSQNNTYYGGITYDNTNGRVGINLSNPAYQLQLQLNSAAKPTSNLWIVASDERIKTVTGEYTKGLAAVCALRPITYKYNGKAGFVVDDKENISIIAQEAMVPFPECVSTFKAKLNEDDAETTELYNWDGHALTFALVNAIKEQQALINQLTDRIAALEGK